MKTMRITADSTRKMNVMPLRTNLLLKERAQAEIQAARLVAAAGKRAKQIIQAARMEAEEAKKAGREEGYRQVASKLAEAASIRDHAAAGCLPELAGLATEMARRIISRELRTSPQEVARICARVIRENHCGRKLSVFVNPDDLELLRERQHAILTDPNATVEFFPSQQVDRGGCVVRGEQGQVDGRLEVQLEELAKAMRES